MASARHFSSTERVDADVLRFPGSVLQQISFEDIATEALQTGAKGSAVVVDRDGMYKCVASAGACVPPIGAVLDVDSGLSGLCLQTGSILKCEDAESDDRVNAEACRALGIRSILIVPVKCGAEIAGLIEVVSDKPEAFDELATAQLVELSKRISNSDAPDGDISASSASLETEPQVTKPNDGVDLNSDPKEETEQKKRVGTGVRMLPIIIATIAIPAAILGFRENRHRASAPTRVTSPAHTSNNPEETTGTAASPNSRQVITQNRDAYTYATTLANDPNGQHDLVEIYAWYVIAASQGDKRGEEAIKNLTPRMTEADIARVRNRLGNIFEHGEGVPAKTETAYFWYTLAEAAGETNASAAKMRLLPHLSAAARTTSEQRAARWLRLHTAAPVQAQIIP